jgi:2-oxoglutarate ferredoxin oxidoreductase subunit beta
MTTTALPPLTRKDFQTDQEVRWCPGCGDYAILAAVQSVFPELGVPREKFVVISGIGCSSRFPYYMNTFGFHTIHGRAPAVATGVKIAHPELEVWLVTGDGDALAIGGNHTIHLLRRNVGIKVSPSPLPTARPTGPSIRSPSPSAPRPPSSRAPSIFSRPT